jgi:hypothetical protein
MIAVSILAARAAADREFALDRRHSESSRSPIRLSAFSVIDHHPSLPCSPGALAHDEVVSSTGLFAEAVVPRPACDLDGASAAEQTGSGAVFLVLC